MKKVFVLSIQHTGTYFASATIAAGFEKKYQLRIGIIYERHRKLGHKRLNTVNPIELSDFIEPSNTVDKSWFDQAVTTVCTPQELAGKKIIVGHEHHHKEQSWLIRALTNAPAQTPIIVPMRDPLLSLHSKLWREDEQHNNPNETDDKARAKRLEGWIIRYKELLSIPKGNVFILPIDAEQSKTEDDRLTLIEDMYSYCNVPFNERAKQVALAWQPDNKTADLIRRVKKADPKPKWENFKTKYEERNIAHTKMFMSLEFNRLNQEDELKELMKKAGYKDVLWW